MGKYEKKTFTFLLLLFIVFYLVNLLKAEHRSQITKQTEHSSPYFYLPVYLIRKRENSIARTKLCIKSTLIYFP